ncbi:MAG: OmpP1/FadL family transporter [Nitrospira sp.]|nr:OmpP1/FadL family transporter [Nitrospira sp.]
MLRKLSLAMAAVAVILALTEASEAGGLFLSEFGTEDVALAGAGWAARAQDASTLFKNPAGMSRLQGNQFQGGLQALYFQGSFSPDVATFGGGGGGNPVGVAPGASGFYVHSLNKDFKVGLGVFSNFGLGLKYDGDWAGRYYLKDTALVGVTFAPVASYRVNDMLSIGGGPNVMVGYFKYTSAVNNLAPVGDGQLQTKDTTAGVGGQFGVLLEPNQRTRFGVTYYSPIKLNFSDDPSLSGLGPGNEAIFGGLRNARLDLGITVPQRVIVSAYHELTDRLALMGNFGWDNWSQFGKVDVSLVSQTTVSGTTAINYQDTYHVAVGGQYRLNPEWLLNGGFAYDSSMVKDQDRTLSLPVGSTYKFGGGVNWLMKPTIKLGFSYELSYLGDLSISQNRGPLAGEVTGQFKDAMMHFFAFTVNWGSQGVIFGPGGEKTPS